MMTEAAEQSTEEIQAVKQSEETEVQTPPADHVDKSQEGPVPEPTASPSEPDQQTAESAEYKVKPVKDSDAGAPGFTINKKSVELELSQEQFKWTLKIEDGKQPPKKDSTSGSVPVAEILAATVTMKAEAVVGFDLHYIQHKPDDIFRQAVIHFCGASEACQAWVIKIQDNLKSLPNRPKKVLVLVNPVGGRRKGRQIYHSTIAPLFELAGVETDVKVTEKPYQMRDEILPAYDLSSISALIICGGDGSYFESLNALLVRAQHQAGVNPDDQASVLNPISIPIAMIPTGTGNGIARMSNGCADVVTATLAVIIGKKKKIACYRVFDTGTGKLLTYAGLIVNYGWIGDTRVYTESKRSATNPLSYVWAGLSTLVKNNPRDMELEIKYLPAESPEQETAQSDQTVDTALRGAESSEWQTVTGTFTQVNTFMGKYRGPPWSKTELTHRDNLDSFVMYLQTKCTVRQNFAQIFYLYNWRFDQALERTHIKTFDVKGIKVSLKSPSDPSSPIAEKELVLDVDGEVFKLTKPEYEIKIDPGTITLFTSFDCK